MTDRIRLPPPPPPPPNFLGPYGKIEEEEAIKYGQDYDRCIEDWKSRWAERSIGHTDVTWLARYCYLFLTHSYVALAGVYDRVGRALHLSVTGKDRPDIYYHQAVKLVGDAFGCVEDVEGNRHWTTLRLATKDQRRVCDTRNVLAHRGSLLRRADFPAVDGAELPELADTMRKKPMEFMRELTDLFRGAFRAYQALEGFIANLRGLSWFGRQSSAKGYSEKNSGEADPQ